jgi:hypothetical protein
MGELPAGEMMREKTKEGFGTALPYQWSLSAREKAASLLGIERQGARRRQMVIGEVKKK